MKFKMMAAVAWLCAGAAAAGTIDLAHMPQARQGGVIETPNVIYASMQGYRPLDLTLYRPAKSAGKLPIVIYIHGGGWGLNPFKPIAGTPEAPNTPPGDTPSSFVKLAARGYVVANVTYRLSSEAKFPAQIQDVKQAVRFLREHATDIGGDPDRIYAWGSSAGGYLVALLGTSCGVKALEPEGNDTVSDCVQGVVDWYGPTDFAKMDAEADSNHLGAGAMPMRHNDASGPESKLLGCALPQCSADLLKETNPITYVSAQNPPFLIIQGQVDTGVPYEQSVLLADALKQAGAKVTLHLVPGANHMFMGISPQAQWKLAEETFAFFDSLK
jgi:acetyl esterase/lipase